MPPATDLKELASRVKTDQPEETDRSDPRDRPSGSERPSRSDRPSSRGEWSPRDMNRPARRLRPRRLGVLPIKAVRTTAFGIISLSIFACGGLCLLAVWGATPSGVPWRALTSLGIVAATMGAFAFVNELFGEAEKNDVGVMGGAA